MNSLFIEAWNSVQTYLIILTTAPAIPSRSGEAGGLIPSDTAELVAGRQGRGKFWWRYAINGGIYR